MLEHCTNCRCLISVSRLTLALLYDSLNRFSYGLLVGHNSGETKLRVSHYESVARMMRQLKDKIVVHDLVYSSYHFLLRGC